jgi:ribosomal protein S18 acetylase RimI-like enzyme
MDRILSAATLGDAAAIAALRAAAADQLTREYGRGHWSSIVSEKAVMRSLEKPGVFVAREGAKVIAVLRLSTTKPWAIDTSYFTAVPKALYLTDMAVDPTVQRQGIGRRCVEEAAHIAREWPCDAIRLDAYDAAAGAGGFYAKCGYREVGRVVYRKNPLIYYELLL